MSVTVGSVCCVQRSAKLKRADCLENIRYRLQYLMIEVDALGCVTSRGPGYYKVPGYFNPNAGCLCQGVKKL